MPVTRQPIHYSFYRKDFDEDYQYSEENEKYVAGIRYKRSALDEDNLYILDGILDEYKEKIDEACAQLTIEAKEYLKYIILEYAYINYGENNVDYYYANGSKGSHYATMQFANAWDLAIYLTPRGALHFHYIYHDEDLDEEPPEIYPYINKYGNEVTITHWGLHTDVTGRDMRLALPDILDNRYETSRGVRKGHYLKRFEEWFRRDGVIRFNELLR